MFLSPLFSLTIVGSIFFSRFSRAQDLSQWRQKILNDHNEYRKRHHSPPLQLKQELNDVAQRYAQHLADIGRMVHSGGKYGENLYSATGVTLTDVLTGKVDPVRAWYMEISFYPSSPFYKWGHFTQVVWKSSKYLGCGAAGKDQYVYVVCNYDPPGNVQSQYEKNVLTIHGDPWPTGTSTWTYAIVFGIVILAIVFGVYVVYGRGRD